MKRRKLLFAETKSEPLTPLLDVLFTVLMAVAMFVKTSANETVIVSNAPPGDSASQPTTDAKRPQLCLSKDGTLTLNGAVVSRDVLVNRIKAANVDRARPTVELRADRECLHHEVTELINELVAGKIHTLEVRRAPTPAATHEVAGK